MDNHVTTLYFKSKTISLVLLAATALICSRLLFVLFNDPEGPNLLIVIVLALVVYAVSAAVYLFVPAKIGGIARLLVVVAIQLLSIIVIYLCMR